MSSPEVDELLAMLEDADQAVRAATLQTLALSPVAEERLLPALKALLDDRTPVVVSVPPPVVGELRWLAAHALASTRFRLGIDEPVRLEAVPERADATRVSAAAEAAGVRGRGGIDGLLETYAELVAARRLQLRDESIEPRAARLTT